MTLKYDEISLLLDILTISIIKPFQRTKFN